MNYKHKNINEPLRILVSLGKGYCGESFNLTFSTGNSGMGIYRHVCKYDAVTGTYISCEPADGNVILCHIPPRKVGQGILYVKKQVEVEDWSMANGKQTISDTSEVTVTVAGREWGVEMTTAATDQFSPSQITTQLLPLFTRGRPGKTRWADLSDEEKLEVAALLPDAIREKGECKSEKTGSSCNDTTYSLATPSTPGLVRIGEGLTVTTEGTLSIDWSYVRRKLMSSTDGTTTKIKTEL